MVEQGAQKQSKENQPVVFSKTNEVIPLGFSNKLLRKAAWGIGFTSFVLTGISGINFKNHWRTASGLGSAAITLGSLLLPEKANALPDVPIPMQMGHAILHPTENTMFFNRSGTFITDALKMVAGIMGGRKKEMWEGALKIGMKSIDIGGISDQDKREKRAVEAAKTGVEYKDHTSALRKVVHLLTANRWVSIGGSMIAATFQLQQAIEHNDKNMRFSAITYFICNACQAADNAIIESKINKEHDETARG